MGQDNSAEPKTPPKPSNTGRPRRVEPAAGPDRVPCAPGHGPAWETRSCQRPWGSTSPAPTQRGPNVPGSQVERDKHGQQPAVEASKTTPLRPRKPNHLVSAALPLEKGGGIQTGKQGMRPNPRQLPCCYTNHDSSHMLAANGAPVPPPRSPPVRTGDPRRSPWASCGQLKAAGARAGQGAGGVGGASGPSRCGRDLGPLPQQSRCVSSPPGTGGCRLTAPGSRGAARGEASAAAGGDPLPA